MRWILIFILAASGPLAAQSSSQPAQDQQKPPSLAELAKRTRQKRQQSQGQTRVITNADLQSLRANVTTGSKPAAPEPSDAEAAEGASEGTDTEGLPTAPPGELTEEDLEQWRAAFNEARTNLQNAVSEGLVLQLRMNNLRNSYLRQADGSTQERIQAQLSQTLEAIEQNRQQQETARRAIERLQQDARQAGLTPVQITELTGQLPEPNPEIVSPETIGG